MNRRRGFTLIELLVVIAIIGVLSSVVLIAVQTARNKAMTVGAQADMKKIAEAIVMAQGVTGKVLLNITGSGCSSCSGCRDGLSHISDAGTCYTRWSTSMNAINTASENYLGSTVTGLLRDPWGSPYSLDENEKEAGSCANHDLLSSMGPNGVFGDSDDVPGPMIPFAQCP